MKKVLLAVIMLALFVPSVFGQSIARQLQDVSVTVHADGGSGSGVIVTREVKVNDKVVKVNFVWTAGHVVDSLRQVRKVIDGIGGEKTVIEFRPAFITKDLIEEGRKVGETRMEAKVIKYSDADNGEDLALLMLYKKDFVASSSKFYLSSNDQLELGTELVHVGSLLGQGGSNSMTTGIMSQVGRVIVLNNKPVVFDQTTVTAFPGSSGGGVFLKDGDHKAEYIGMLVRGAGETFNLIVPVRRMRSWAVKNNVEWALDETKPVPALDEFDKINTEDIQLPKATDKKP